MQEAFGTVLWIVVGVGVLVAVITFFTARGAYDEIGRGIFADEPPPAPAAGSPASRAEAEAEIRQFIEARNHRREQRGQAPLDVEAELGRLTMPAPSADPALAAEIRDLVVARNERRARRGEAPLDVDAEVARQLRELGA